MQRRVRQVHLMCRSCKFRRMRARKSGYAEAHPLPSMLSQTNLHPTDLSAVGAPPEPGPDVARLAHTLQESEERLQIALEAGGMGIWEIELATGRNIWWPGMERLHGMAAD